MTNIPKKLEYHGGPIHDDLVVGDLVQGYNQLIDYLSDRDGGECKKVCGGRHYHSFWRYSDKCMGCGKTLEECNSPQQEESKGGCDKCGGLPFKHEKWCGTEPQLKEESPKEDEWEAKFDRVFGIDDDWDAQLYHYLPSGLKVANKSVKDYIKANFVSKEKIKRLADEYSKRDIAMGWKFGALEVIDKLLED